MDGFQVALVVGLIILLCAVMFLATKIHKLHGQARYLRRLVQKLEGKDTRTQKEIDTAKDDMGGGD